MREVELLTGELQEQVAANTVIPPPGSEQPPNILPMQRSTAYDSSQSPQPVYPDFKDAPKFEDLEMADEYEAVDFGGFLSPEEFESEIGAFESLPTEVALPTTQDPEAWKTFMANQAAQYNAIAARNNAACQANSSVRNGLKSVLKRDTCATAGGKLMVKKAKGGVIQKLA